MEVGKTGGKTGTGRFWCLVPFVAGFRRMRIPKLRCPCCGVKQPFSRLLFSTPWSKIQCCSCGAHIALRKAIVLANIPFALLIGLPAMLLMHESSVSGKPILYFLAVLWLVAGFLAFLFFLERVPLRVVVNKSLPKE
jgi:uncharacterized protein (DUF983 family)